MLQKTKIHFIKKKTLKLKKNKRKSQRKHYKYTDLSPNIFKSEENIYFFLKTNTFYFRNL